jgi:TQXA domain-containing protein
MSHRRIRSILPRRSGALAAAVLAVVVLGAVPAALAATATFVSTASGRSVSGLQNGNPRSVGFAGTFNVEIDGTPPSVEAYCVDIGNPIGFGDTIPQAPVDYPGEVLFILNNAFPQPSSIGTPLGSAADEAAAVQCAIWSYTDNMVCTTPANVATRAAAIVAAASTAGPLLPAAVPHALVVDPPSASNVLPDDDSHAVTATLYDADGAPLGGFTIGLAVTSGPAAGFADSGPSPVLASSYTNAVAGTDTIVASTTFSVPTGQKFKMPGKQGIVLAGDPVAGTVTGSATKSWVTAACGNGVREGGEQCDDGNAVDTDSCTNGCLDARCGDGFVQPGEQCDDGNQSQNDACKNDCQTNVCGDQIVDPAAEECDDGNAVNGDGCTNACTSPACGDGIQQTGEQCDDGNSVNGDSCTNQCTNALCGDGITGPGEECDDGNQSNLDACTNGCDDARCGDGFVGPGEQCDDGNVVDDDGCSNACQLPECGDGIVQSGEECDDGNTVNTDACTTACQAAACGDGFVGAGEECDDGNAVDADACTNACTIAECGDGVVGPGEQCDDGNTVGGDGCDAACGLPYCGDGAVNQPSEQCDDGNNLSGDGCSPICTASEICTNQMEDDGDGKVDCDDPDCGCLVITGVCNHPCPARISYKPKGPDRLQFQVSFSPTQSIDPANVSLGVTLTNANGIIYSAALLPGDLKKVGKAWAFRDTTAVKGPGIRGGLQSVRVRTKDGLSYRVDLRANSDLLQQFATLPDMTIQLVVGNEAFQKAATWEQIKNGWRVHLQ